MSDYGRGWATTPLCTNTLYAQTLRDVLGAVTCHNKGAKEGVCSNVLKRFIKNMSNGLEGFVF